MAFHWVEPLTAAPGGRVNTWSVEMLPLAMISTLAPLASGSPTIESLLSSSLPRTTTLRDEEATPGCGSFTTKDLPSTYWSVSVVVVMLVVDVVVVLAEIVLLVDVLVVVVVEMHVPVASHAP